MSRAFRIAYRIVVSLIVVKLGWETDRALGGFFLGALGVAILEDER